MRLVTLSHVNSETLTLINCILIYIACCEHKEVGHAPNCIMGQHYNMLQYTPNANMADYSVVARDKS